MEAEMARVLRTIEPDLAEAGVTPLDLVSGFLMKTSARNAIRGNIINIVSDALSAEVEISVSPETTIYSLVTHASMEELGLCAGRSVTLLIKAPFVAIATGKTAPKTSARNCINGICQPMRRHPPSAPRSSSISALTRRLHRASLRNSAKSLGLSPGKPAFALFDAAHVIIAIN